MTILLIPVLGGCVSTAPENDHEHEKVKFHYTAYNNDYELYIEADPFIAGDSANVLSHFTLLKEFAPLEKGSIRLLLWVNEKETSQTLSSPFQKGIYNFNIIPEKPGKGRLRFEITGGNGTSVLEIPEVHVYETDEAAHAAAESEEPPKINTTSFTKEQSWKVDFATGYPEKGAFGQVIKTTALVKPSPESEMVITAKTNGIVSFTNNSILEGREVSNRQALFTISGGEMAENNFSVRYSEAKNEFEKASADYERAKELSKDKIVSEKDLLNAKIRYDNARTVFENLNKNFSASGQNVISPINGFVKQVFVRNGSYVEAGEPVLTISQDKTLILTADVSQKYASVLSSIKSADIRTIYDKKVYSLADLNGKIISYGKSAGSGNFLIPVNLEVENRGIFTPGTFVEVYLKTVISMETVSVPNEALLEEQNNFFVYTQINPELFEKREVAVGSTDGLRTEILSGINENDRIVTRGAIFIKLSQSTGTLDAHSGHVH